MWLLPPARVNKRVNLEGVKRSLLNKYFPATFISSFILCPAGRPRFTYIMDLMPDIQCQACIHSGIPVDKACSGYCPDISRPVSIFSSLWSRTAQLAMLTAFPREIFATALLQMLRMGQKTTFLLRPPLLLRNSLLVAAILSLNVFRSLLCVVMPSGLLQ